MGVAVDVSEASAGGSVSAADAELAVKAAASAAGEAAAKEAAAHYEPQLRAEEEEGEDDARTVIQRKRLRSSRVVSILRQATGQEATLEGEERTERVERRAPGMFTASNYFWGYYASAPATGMTIVPITQVAKEGQCHGILDSAANLDADSVDNSNSLYEYAGIDQTQPELLYAKTFTCTAECCRGRGAISTEFRGCKFAE